MQDNGDVTGGTPGQNVVIHGCMSPRVHQQVNVDFAVIRSVEPGDCETAHGVPGEG